jgi:hypothetical protein
VAALPRPRLAGNPEHVAAENLRDVLVLVTVRDEPARGVGYGSAGLSIPSMYMTGVNRTPWWIREIESCPECLAQADVVAEERVRPEADVIDSMSSTPVRDVFHHRLERVSSDVWSPRCETSMVMPIGRSLGPVEEVLMRDVRVAHPEVEQDVVPTPAAHAVDERLEDDVDTRRRESRKAGPGAALVRLLVDLADVLRHDDSVVVRRDQRRSCQDPLEAFGLVSIERVGGGRHAAELPCEVELPVIGARIEVLEGPVRCAAL